MTKWGVKLDGDVDVQLTVCQKLGCSVIRTSEAFGHYDGRIPFVDKANVKGVGVLLNLVNEDARNGVTRSFPKNLDAVRTQLTNLLKKYKPEVGVIENEPTTDGFWGTSPVSDYVDELKTAVSVCVEQGVRSTDGGTHILNWQILRTGKGHSKNAPDVKTLLTAYKGIAGLTFVNFHHKIQVSSYIANDFRANIKWAQDFTGKPLMCNELHIDSPDQATLDSVMQICIDEGVAYLTRWGFGATDPELASGSNLTSYGNIYKNLIASKRNIL